MRILLLILTLLTISACSTTCDATVCVSVDSKPIPRRVYQECEVPVYERDRFIGCMRLEDLHR